MQVAGAQARGLANPVLSRGFCGPTVKRLGQAGGVRGDSAQARVQELMGAAAKCDLAPCTDHTEPS